MAVYSSLLVFPVGTRMTHVTATHSNIPVSPACVLLPGITMYGCAVSADLTLVVPTCAVVSCLNDL